MKFFDIEMSEELSAVPTPALPGTITVRQQSASYESSADCKIQRKVDKILYKLWPKCS